MQSDEWRPGGCSRPVVRLQRRHGHPVLTFMSLAPSGRMNHIYSSDNETLTAGCRN